MEEAVKWRGRYPVSCASTDLHFSAPSWCNSA